MVRGHELRCASRVDCGPFLGVVSAPLWNSERSCFAGMFTVSDIIHLIQYYYKCSSYDAAAADVETFRLESLRGAHILPQFSHAIVLTSIQTSSDNSASIPLHFYANILLLPCTTRPSDSFRPMPVAYPSLTMIPRPGTKSSCPYSPSTASSSLYP